MKIFVLIAVVRYGVTAQEFTSLEKCNKAGNEIVQKYNEVSGVKAGAGFICIER